MSDDITCVINQIVKSKMNKVSKSKGNVNSHDDVRDIVQRINTAYHNDWEKQKLEFARNFLSRTWAGIPLPVLSLCGKGTQEIRYSKYLAYFLDGSKAHGVGMRYLDGLLLLATEKKMDTYLAVVENEKWIGQAAGKTKLVDCFCDIVIFFDNTVVFIEQKIRSSESMNPNSKTTQLKRYDEAIAMNPEFEDKEQIRIYLTPTGKVSDISSNWTSVSYNDLVRIGIDLLHSGGLSGVARENLKRFLLDIVLGPFEKTEDEIQDMVEFAEKAVTTTSFSDRLDFDRKVSKNKLLIEIIMEG
jgi:hypothetical protein